MTPYAELHIASNFSFLRGASHPEELALAAATLGLKAFAITDRNSLAGVVRAHGAAREAGIRLVVGARLELADGLHLLCYPTDRAAYGRLSRLLTVGKRRAPKDGCELYVEDVMAHGKGQIVIAVPPEQPGEEFVEGLRELRVCFKKRLYLAASFLYGGDDAARLRYLAEIAAEVRVPLVATNDVHAHAPARRPLQDVLTCIREHVTIHEAGYRLAANAERHLKPGDEMARLFRDHPDAIARTIEIAEACRFSLEELRYEYPVDPVPAGRTPQQELERLAWKGANLRYPGGVPDKVRAQVAHELTLISGLAYAPYFLTVHDIVRFARSRGILCQGRGSAANSAVCYCLGITAVDPARIDVLFERFVSAARNEPPDIDVDFEHERREEVIQYVYGKYGRERAGMTATVICYRGKSAVREVGKAMGLSEDAIVALQGVAWRRHWDDITPEMIAESGLDPADHTVRMVMELAGEIRGFPRHLSQHTGGMVITRTPLSEVVPIANAAMDDRTVIEWDKDDLDALGILKIDILGLGMLTCIRKAFDLVRGHYGRALTLATVPAEDPRVYDMLCEADSLGVFQVESRAQMGMLPRLRPRCFYDLVIEVAIVRPGPIQGDMVHPYLRRRCGEERVSFPSQELESVLGKTMGVPLFQEQVMKIAIVAAGFSPAEADALRRSMATFKRNGQIHGFHEKFVRGMVERGYEAGFAERCFHQIEGFADYGFPESHAASFALLVYVSAWIKRHYPEAFACALLNSQPMGFYAPAQIVRDARQHGVDVRAVDVSRSDWDCTLERSPSPPIPERRPAPTSPSRRCAAGPSLSPLKGGEGKRALRLGFRQVKGLAARDVARVLEVRGEPAALWRAGVPKPALEILARADAFRSHGLTRRPALWAVRALDDGAPLPLFAAADARRPEPPVELPPMSLGEEMMDDYRMLRLSLKVHPMALLRPQLARLGYAPCRILERVGHDACAAVAGVVTCRQRPGTAHDTMFVTLEDEDAIANLIVWKRVFEGYRKEILRAGLLAVRGRVQREGKVIHLLADHVEDLTALLHGLQGQAFPAPDAERLPRGRRSIAVAESHDFR